MHVNQQLKYLAPSWQLLLLFLIFNVLNSLTISVSNFSDPVEMHASYYCQAPVVFMYGGVLHIVFLCNLPTERNVDIPFVP